MVSKKLMSVLIVVTQTVVATNINDATRQWARGVLVKSAHDTMVSTTIDELCFRCAENNATLLTCIRFPRHNESKKHADLGYTTIPSPVPFWKEDTSQASHLLNWNIPHELTWISLPNGIITQAMRFDTRVYNVDKQDGRRGSVLKDAASTLFVCGQDDVGTKMSHVDVLYPLLWRGTDEQRSKHALPEWLHNDNDNCNDATTQRDCKRTALPNTELRFDTMIVGIPGLCTGEVHT